MTKNWKKWKLKKFFLFFWSKIAIYLSLGLYKGRPSYRRSLQPSKENIQQFKTWNLFTFVGPPSKGDLHHTTYIGDPPIRVVAYAPRSTQPTVRRTKNPLFSKWTKTPFWRGKNRFFENEPSRFSQSETIRFSQSETIRFSQSEPNRFFQNEQFAFFKAHCGGSSICLTYGYMT